MPSQLISLIRIIGNDLPPRHASIQSTENTNHILELEPDFKDCKKIWILNRIICQEKLAKLHHMITSKGYICVTIPFSYAEYSKIPKYSHIPHWVSPFARRKLARRHLYARRLRLTYLTNINSARNFAISLGHSFSSWAIPLDGNCIFTAEGFHQITKSIANPMLRYIVIPMRREMPRSTVPISDVKPIQEEPQLGFHYKSLKRFNESYYYGRRDKSELLKRLGVTGDWDSWNLDPWEERDVNQAVDDNLIESTGYVNRLPSGNKESDQDYYRRSMARDAACISLLDYADNLKIPPRLQNN